MRIRHLSRQLMGHLGVKRCDDRLGFDFRVVREVDSHSGMSSGNASDFLSGTQDSSSRLGQGREGVDHRLPSSMQIPDPALADLKLPKAGSRAHPRRRVRISSEPKQAVQKLSYGLLACDLVDPLFQGYMHAFSRQSGPRDFRQHPSELQFLSKGECGGLQQFPSRYRQSMNPVWCNKTAAKNRFVPVRIKSELLQNLKSLPPAIKRVRAHIKQAAVFLIG
ncbi:hypothetical protein D3C81_1040690 [compost metagenome]